MNLSLWMLILGNSMILLVVLLALYYWTKPFRNLHSTLNEILHPIITQQHSDVTQFCGVVKDQLESSTSAQYNQLRGFQNELHHLIQMTDKRLEMLTTQNGTSMHDLRQEICLKLDQIRKENNTNSQSLSSVQSG